MELQEYEIDGAGRSASTVTAWGPLQTHSPAKLGENYVRKEKKKHLNSLEMVLRTYRKWKNIYSWKSTTLLWKNKQTVEACGISQDAPFPSPSQLSDTESPLQIVQPRTQDSVPHRYQRAVFPEGQGIVFLILPPATCCWSYIPYECRPHSGYFITEKIWGPNHPCLGMSSVVLHWKRQIEKTY